MDKVVSIIIEKLVHRKNSSLNVYLDTNQRLTKKMLLSSEQISVKQIQASHLHQLNNQIDSEWVRWINEGLSLNNKFHFYLSDDLWQLIPINLLLKWPIIFYDIKMGKIQIINDQVITYHSVANLQDNSVLIKFKRQLLTDYARDTCLKKEITILERV